MLVFYIRRNTTANLKCVGSCLGSIMCQSVYKTKLLDTKNIDHKFIFLTIAYFNFKSICIINFKKLIHSKENLFCSKIYFVVSQKSVYFILDFKDELKFVK